MDNLQKVAPGALVVGKPLPWAVYDENGGLLLRQGFVIQTEGQLEKLYERGLFQSPLSATKKKIEEDREEGRRVSPFAEYAPLLSDLELGLEAVMQQKPHAKERILGLARRINEMCKSDPDASIALVHIYAVEPTAYEQTLFYAILCRFIARHMRFDREQAMILMAAALTANLALLPHQDKLNNSTKKLSEAQRAVINKHPLLSVIALDQAGVQNKRFLRVIAQHHERFDGSGYPKGLSGDDILPEAKALALAERYTAMVTRRAYRDRFRSDHARQDILTSVAEDPDQSVYQALFRALGDYPPGILVQLRNGETAVVTRRAKGDGMPETMAVVSASGNAYMGGIRRNAEDEDFAIEEVVVPKYLPALNLSQLWGYG
ncbi:HD domain-containing phosphohydrolase [Marinobacteraceae bacterium S3BR75-40.1]